MSANWVLLVYVVGGYVSYLDYIIDVAPLIHIGRQTIRVPPVSPNDEFVVIPIIHPQNQNIRPSCTIQVFDSQDP